MRRRMLNKMQTEQDEQSRSEDVKARLVPAVILSVVVPPLQYFEGGQPLPEHSAYFMRNDSVAPQGTAQSSPQGSVPPAPAAPLKRGPGRPRKNLA